MVGIKKMCDSVYKECTAVNSLEMLNPKIINNPAVYSIIVNKYYLAQSKNITMNIEVMFDFDELDVNIYEFSNILGILLDNAIEAASECFQKLVNIKFIKDFKTNNKLVIIENTYNETNINLNKIFEKGYSTKKDDKENHGLGLWNVKKILSHQNGINLYTSKGKYFSQKLEITSKNNELLFN